ncbi:MAG: ferredoxin-thioredoxin reductase catalytic domain-containing protein [Arcobacteraceae bacterium]|jgi:ferredoxin-thioredoxin reductase catalytic subunit/rhodanese-related sulfurtransferase|nr:ferredoxin-thioredoxin reductase catalytic domain-containing protein [Arcobacteraceae bacterium]
MIKIDMNSQEFLEEQEKTKIFTDKVCASKGWVYNPIVDVNEGVIMGLTRNKLIFNKRYCPCFMVIGETKEEQRAADNRICPCKPAMEHEIPDDGHCHCGIFCTPEYAKANAIEIKAEEVAHSHSRGLTKEECEVILKHPELDGDEIESLLEARELGMVEFNLVDVREWMEWKQGRIAGTDYLIPTTSFYNQLGQIEDQKEKPTIVYCLTGSRSAYCQEVLKDMGWKQVSNYRQGIIAYRGKVIKGE